MYCNPTEFWYLKFKHDITYPQIVPEEICVFWKAEACCKERMEELLQQSQKERIRMQPITQRIYRK